MAQTKQHQVDSAGNGALSADIGQLGEQFVASLNHDIRTPLSGILGMTDLLHETELTEEQQEYVATTKLCADQLLELLNSALEFAALSAGTVTLEPTEFHLPQVIRAVVQEFAVKAEAKNLRLQCLCDGLPEYAFGDELRLRQALAPLVANAVKFTHEGEILVTGEAPASPGDSETLLQLSVRDTGIGVQPEKLKLIFDSFRQLETGLSRSFAGMGLGLAITRKLASLMGGAIEVESVPGQGSDFRLKIPLQLPHHQTENATAPVEHPEHDDGAPAVLLVDDNDVARRVVTHILNRAGYRIDCAEDGERGVNAAGNHHYDLILMDLQMPGMNGLDATQAIRRLNGYESIPILALTANYSEEFVRSCGETGFDGFLSKPVQRTQLVAELDRRLR